MQFSKNNKYAIFYFFYIFSMHFSMSGHGPLMEVLLNNTSIIKKSLKIDFPPFFSLSFVLLPNLLLFPSGLLHFTENCLATLTLTLFSPSVPHALFTYNRLWAQSSTLTQIRIFFLLNRDVFIIFLRSINFCLTQK